jgi:hypothetical protein
MTYGPRSENPIQDKQGINFAEAYDELEFCEYLSKPPLRYH